MLHLPVLRWGQPYTSMDVDDVVHFATGEPIAKVSRANGGMIQRDMRKAQRARDVLREIPIDDLIARVGNGRRALHRTPTLPMGDGTQTPDEFVRAQSASTGLPERLCRANMKKNKFVLSEMRRILTSLTRGLDLDVLSRGYGEERGVPISYQAQSPVLGLVLPSNSPGVHTLWLPIIPMQIGLVLKPGPQEPWTPYRMAEAFFQAGIPREAISVYPGEGDVGAAVLDELRPQPDLRRHRDGRSLSRQPEGAGARPGLLEDPLRRRSGRRLGEVPRRDGRQRVRQQRTRLHQLLGHLGEPSHARDRRRAGAAARGRAAAAARSSGREPRGVHGARASPTRSRASIDADLQAPGVTDVTATVPRRCRASSSRAAPTTSCRRSSTARRRRPRSRRRNTCSRS